MLESWFNGARHRGPIPIAPDDEALLRGLALFETFPAYHGQALFLERHVARLAKASATLGLTSPTIHEITTGVAGLSETHPTSERLRFRLTVAHTWWLLTAGPWPEVTAPATVVTSRWRLAARRATAGLKCVSYADHVRAQTAAIALGATDALLLNESDAVCEAAYANVFLLTEQGLITPPLSAGCLDGIVRGLVFEIGKSLGIDIIERPLLPAELLTKRTTPFLTSSTRGLHRIASLDGQPVGVDGPRLTELVTAYRELAGLPRLPE
jgi:branched-chain amino acid aminotransferase